MPIKFIIEGRRWFDKINGNTYHAVRIFDTEKLEQVADIPRTYGYGDHWKTTALDWLIKNGSWSESDRHNHEKKRAELYFNCVDVQRMKDLIE